MKHNIRFNTNIQFRYIFWITALCLIFGCKHDQAELDRICNSVNENTIITVNSTPLCLFADTSSTLIFTINTSVLTDKDEAFDFVTSDGLLIYQGQIGSSVHIVVNNSTPNVNAQVQLRASATPDNNVTLIATWRCGTSNFAIKFLSMAYQLSLTANNNYSAPVTSPIQVTTTLTDTLPFTIPAPGLLVNYTINPDTGQGAAPATTVYRFGPASFGYISGTAVKKPDTQKYELSNSVSIVNTSGQTGAGRASIKANMIAPSGVALQSQILIDYY